MDNINAGKDEAANAQPKQENAQEPSSLPPPKSLPDLAKDIFETAGSISFDKPSEKVAIQASERAVPRTPPEPQKASVPRFDMNLLKEPLKEAPRELVKEQPPMPAPQYTPSSHPHAYPAHEIEYQYAQGTDRDFFKEIEHYVLHGNGAAAFEMLSGDIIAKMRSYHGSSIKDSLSELNDLEHLWMIAGDRLRQSQALTTSIEAELYLKSQALKGNLAAGMPLSTLSSMVQAGVSPEGSKAVMPRLASDLLVKRSDQNTQTGMHAVPAVEGKPNDIIIYDSVLVDNASFFYVVNGVVLKSINELLNALIVMDSQTFDYHVNAAKNDFANWIAHVYKRPDVARLMQLLPTRQALIEFLVARLR